MDQLDPVKAAGDELVRELLKGVNELNDISEADKEKLRHAIANIEKGIQDDHDRELASRQKNMEVLDEDSDKV